MRALARALVLVVVLAAPAAAGHQWMAALLTIDPDSLRRLTVEGRPVALVDVRPAEAFRDGRLPGARSIPLSTLVPRHDEIPSTGFVVLYCGEGTDDAATAYRYLRAAGRRNVFVLEGGLAAWRARGYAVER